MANPQREEGFTGISNELTRAFARFSFTPQERRVLDIILWLTYGTNRGQRTCQTSDTFLAENTGLDQPRVCRIIQRLIDHQVLTATGRKRGRRGYTIGLQKDYEQWCRMWRGQRTQPLTGQSLKRKRISEGETQPTQPSGDTKKRISKAQEAHNSRPQEAHRLSEEAHNSAEEAHTFSEEAHMLAPEVVDASGVTGAESDSESDYKKTKTDRREEAHNSDARLSSDSDSNGAGDSDRVRVAAAVLTGALVVDSRFDPVADAHTIARALRDHDATLDTQRLAIVAERVLVSARDRHLERPPFYLLQAIRHAWEEGAGIERAEPPPQPPTPSLTGAELRKSWPTLTDPELEEYDARLKDPQPDNQEWMSALMAKYQGSPS